MNTVNVVLVDLAAVSATADIDFSTADIDDVEVDKCVDVYDDKTDPANPVFLGNVCADADPFSDTFSYSLDIGANPNADIVLECGETTLTNTAWVQNEDEDVLDDDDWTVDVEVECVEGCTLTQGYWKTHSEHGKAPYDDRWVTAVTPQGRDTPILTSGFTWYEIFWMSPQGGNAYLQLAHQYMAAKLNILNGAASTPAVDAAILFAEGFFPGKTPSTTLTPAQRNAARAAASTLDDYNNGLIGPGHCSEDSNSIS